MVYGLASAIDPSPCGLSDGRGGKQHTRPRFRHEFLPFRVDPSLRQDHSAPSPRPHYQASTLLRADPTLCHALVLSPSGVFPLWLSLTLVVSRIPRPPREPGPRSRRLYAGHHRVRKQVSSRPGPRPTTEAWFR